MVENGRREGQVRGHIVTGDGCLGDGGTTLVGIQLAREVLHQARLLTLTAAAPASRYVRDTRRLQSTMRETADRSSMTIQKMEMSEQTRV